MGFRSYIREFLVAILMLFRPSGPCCFPMAGGSVSELGKLRAKIILLVFSHSLFLNRRSSKKERSYIREFLVAILMLFRPSLPWCFPIRGLSFEQKE